MHRLALRALLAKSGRNYSAAEVVASAEEVKPASQVRLSSTDWTPERILASLDEHVIGQDKPKRAMAVAMRNRWRRFRVSEDARAEITPKNILLVGSTGIGKTEIARRMAKLTDAPFVKVEMTKFSETGFVGLSVDDIIIQLYRVALRKVEGRIQDGMQADSRAHAYKCVAEIIERLNIQPTIPHSATPTTAPVASTDPAAAPSPAPAGEPAANSAAPADSAAKDADAATASPSPTPDPEKKDKKRRTKRTVASVLTDLTASGDAFDGGIWADTLIPLPPGVTEAAHAKVWPSQTFGAKEGSRGSPPLGPFGDASQQAYAFFLQQGAGARPPSMHSLMSQVGGRGGGGGGPQTKVSTALRLLARQWVNERVDAGAVKTEARRACEEEGIVFLDEIDKIVTSANEKGSSGSSVSAEGVQQDLLPIVEGCDVRLSDREEGSINTSHILFLSAGAFHKVKTTDMLPELQGRFPVVVKMDSLGRNDLRRILAEPKNSLLVQQRELMKVERVDLVFTECGIGALADAAFEANALIQDIGARRLITVVERTLSDLSYDYQKHVGKTVTVDQAYVKKHLGDLLQQENLRVQIL